MINVGWVLELLGSDYHLLDFEEARRFSGGPSSRFARFYPEAVSLPGSLCDKRKKHISKAGLLDGSGATAAPGSMTWQM
ncbi:protein of unknown function [Agrobacterium pusense]|uniref:Uncharacterized protein n=1 Tax=Agrobacterium pusense TaxID=648995 RepID=U4Q0U8_9HYPH|nr:protein of unknown function [Agrobacterium pusense]